MSQYNSNPPAGEDDIWSSKAGTCHFDGCLDEFNDSNKFCDEHEEEGFARIRERQAAEAPVERVPASPDEPDIWKSARKVISSGYRPEFGGAFFHDVQDSATGRVKRTFMPRLLAETILEMQPIAIGSDGRYWSFQGGVWRPDHRVVQRMVVNSLGESYKPAHFATVNDIIENNCPVIECEAVPRYLNFTNGLLDWRTGELLPHDPKVLSTVQFPVDYDPTAECPEFDKFISEVVPGDMVETMWELTGYMMHSGNPLQKAIMLTGSGRNGKGTYLRVLNKILGRENVSAVDLKSLSRDVNRFAGSSLFGKIANICGDIDSSYIEDTGMFKMITGADPIMAERKGKDHFEFTCWATPMFSANKIPGSSDVTVGYLARWVVVPFPYSFAGREDPDLEGRITTSEELRGVVAKAVPALRRLMERKRFAETETSRSATAEFQRRVDQVRSWVDEWAEMVDDARFENRTVLYNSYKEWAKDGGYGQLRSNEFYDRLQAMGVQPAKVRGVRGFKGIRLLTFEERNGDASNLRVVQDAGEDPFARPEGEDPWNDKKPAAAS